MVRSRYLALFVLAFMCCTAVLFGQEHSKKRDIAVFRLGYSSFQIPDNVPGPSDAAIRDVFVNLGQFTISTNGSNRSETEAVRSAINSIPAELSSRAQQMSAFRVKIGILEFSGGDVVIESGRNRGVKPGDEFAVITPKIVAGHEEDEVSGLLLVKEVRAEYSLAHPLYVDRKFHVGDQLREIPRFGLEATFYGDAVFGYRDFAPARLTTFPLFGLRFTVTRGLQRCVCRSRADSEVLKANAGNLYST